MKTQVMMSSLTVASQTAAPAWVRARAMSVHLLVFSGVMTGGSVAWGALAERFGNTAALLGAALALALAATRRWPLQQHQRLDLSPSGHWPDPTLAITPGPEDGPVLVTVEYRVPAERTPTAGGRRSRRTASWPSAASAVG